MPHPTITALREEIARLLGKLKEINKPATPGEEERRGA